MLQNARFIKIQDHQGYVTDHHPSQRTDTSSLRHFSYPETSSSIHKHLGKTHQRYKESIGNKYQREWQSLTADNASWIFVSRSFPPFRNYSNQNKDQINISSPICEYRLKFSPHNQIMTKPLSEGNVRNVHSEAGKILIAIYSHQEWEGKKNPRVRERARSCRPLTLEFATKSASSWACMDGCIMDCNDIHSPSFCCYPLLSYRKRSCPFMVFSRSTEHQTSIG
jgi:hypothetical protein